MLTQGHEEEKKPAEEGEVPYNQRYEQHGEFCP